MIAYVTGPITFKTPTYIVIEAGGVGYQLNISLYTYARIEKEERAKLLVHYHVSTQDYQPTLYGFADDAERGLFRMLIGVNGVGLNTARIILSALSPEELRSTILSDDVVTLRKIKGIGAKTAQRLILDLKDKMLKSGGEGEMVVPALVTNNEYRQEAIMALVALGYARPAVQKTLNKLLKEGRTYNGVQDMIKDALQALR